MKPLFLLTCFIMSVGGQTDSNPIISPLLSTFPCPYNPDIVIYFEPGLSWKESNRYWVYVRTEFPGYSKITIMFDSEVNTTFVVKNANEYSRFSPGTGNTLNLHFFKPVRDMGFFVKGTVPGVTPNLISFSVDGVEYCEEPEVNFLEQYASRTVEKNEMSCGRRVVDQTPLIVGGEDTKPGDWPWHAAIYQLDRETLANKYACGGTLVSSCFVLTAGHCASYRGQKLQKEVLGIILGKYQLKGDDEESIEKEVLEIILHPDFGYSPSLRHDIALLKLNTEVVFNEFIRPACLLRPEDAMMLSSGEIEGTIVGWGFDKNESLSRTLKQASMPIVPEATCLKSHPFFYVKALNGDFTFCAGKNDGRSACNGDSGGAFMVFIPDPIQIGDKKALGRWHVKGIVSNAVARIEVNTCDPEHYVVFTNVEPYIHWIDQYLKG